MKSDFHKTNFEKQICTCSLNTAMKHENNQPLLNSGPPGLTLTLRFSFCNKD